MIENIVHSVFIEEWEVLDYIEKVLSVINILTKIEEIYEADEE